MAYQFNWELVLSYRQVFISGVLLGLGITLATLTVGSFIGLAAAAGSRSRWPAIRWVVRGYVELFRNVPLLLWAYFVYFGLGTLGIGTLDRVTSFVLALSLYGGAYLTEVFRAGLTAIPARYGEAAMAVGLRRDQRIRLVTLPLMFRIVLPSLSNTLIGLFKDTSIASAIAVGELTFAAIFVNNQTARIIEVWVIAGLGYLAVSYAIALALRQVERRYRIVA